MTDHDPWCPRWLPEPFHLCQCGVIAKVRADERDTATSVAAEMMNEAWTNLRAKVQALRDEVMDHARDGYQTAPAIVAYQTVLALIDGSNND